MKKVFALLILFSACSANQNERSSAKKEISNIMQKQVDNWNSGNLEAFMQPYWQSDSLLFIGKNGVQNGWETTLKNYEKSYGDKSSMGKLQFENLQFKALNNNNSWVLGKWTLFRSADTLSGYYTLLWQYKNGRWVIIADHSS